ncbi:MAG: hypothetical protein K2Y37_05785 [Pirellulales bacterium]|nr:hypothetical protein [Pirellulales bacterium]
MSRLRGTSWSLTALVVLALAARGLQGDEPPGKPGPAAPPEAAARPSASGHDFAAASAVLRKYCVGCHNADDKEGGLVLESFETLLAGGEHGAVIRSGASAESRLMRVLTGQAEPKMPPEGSEAPTKDELAIFVAWIDAGANGPTGVPPDPTALVVPRVALRAAPRAAVHSVAWSRDGKLLALGGYRSARLVSVEDRGTVRVLDGGAGNITDLYFSADGSKLWGVGGEPGLFGEVCVWEVATGSLLRSLRGHKDSLYALALSADDKLLATAGYDQQIVLWDSVSGQQQATLSGHSGAVFDLQMRADGKLLASASADRTVKLWDIPSRQRLETFGQALAEVNAVALSPDARRVVAGGADNRIRLWQLSESAAEGTNPLLVSRFAHEGPILRLVWSPDGKTIASSAEDRTVKLWNAGTVEERLLLPPQSDWAASIAFSPDGKQLVAGRLDGSFEIYDVATGKLAPRPKPQLLALSPRGIQRGSTVRVELAGKHLVDVEGVEAGHPALKFAVASDVAPASERLIVDVTVAADAARGKYDVTVITPGGKSGGLPLYVDDLSQYVEREPNNLPQQAATVGLPITNWGVIGAPGDADYYRFELQAGQTVVCEAAIKEIGSKLDAVLILADATGRSVARSQLLDDGAVALCAFTVPTSGAYLLRVGDLMQAGSADHTYRLAIGSFPYVTGWFPLSVPAGASPTVSLVGFNLPTPATITLPSGPPETDAEQSLDQNLYRGRKSVQVAIGALPETLEAEPNGVPEQATTVAVPGTVGGRIWNGMATTASTGASPDVDLFRFASRKGQSWIIETEAARRGSPLDTKIDVLDATGRPVQRVLLQATRDSQVTFRNIDSRQIDVRVENWEEMELNELMYLGGEVCKIFRLPQGPDSGFQFYASQGSRLDYFDTSGTVHAVGEPCYIVQPHAPGTQLLPNGLPVFTMYYENDDDGRRRLGRDSRLTFTAPADGEYLVRVSDVRGFGGDALAYRLTIREPRPDFRVSVSGSDPTVKAGGGRNIAFNVERIDDFDGDITVEVTGLPPGFAISTPVVIPAGHSSAAAVLFATSDAPQPTAENAANSKITATAAIAGSPVTREVRNLGHIKLAPRGNVLVRLEPAEITIAPGQSVPAILKVERHDFDNRINFSVENLPHGVIVDNIGLNGVLIREKETERQIFLTARDWVPEQSRQAHAVGADAGGEASPPVWVHVRRPSSVAQVSATSEQVAPSEKK